ncbi:hypothetical protein M153_6900013873 [Pseudoloma neurophilia]|uniref:Uncharacterized protein n=1 Tax=Pseudoloma neurophilia TaxID=146866 RepID=A0A0R0M0R0_9MICR|nr:hypothetical protein M153_6900013873 [Pseudoloma neurophilia]
MYNNIFHYISYHIQNHIKSAMCGTSFFKRNFKWIFFLIKPQNSDISKRKLLKNESKSYSDEQAPANRSITHHNNQNIISLMPFDSDSTIKRDPSKPLFKSSKDKETCIAPLFNVLFRLENSFIKCIKRLKIKDDSMVNTRLVRKIK